jgi:pullulanase
VQIYLPPGYERQPNRRYPVMYMFDGQNLFDESTAFAGEWHVDETCERMIGRGELPGMIVVGINNGGEHRIREQTPWPTFIDPGPPEGDAFLEWIIHDLKPRIDRGFRTLPDAANTGIGGSSLGGLTSLYAGLEHPSVFGRVLAMSSAFWIGGRRIHDVIRVADRRHRPRVYLDCGRYEGARNSQALFLKQSRDVADGLRQMGFRDRVDLMWVEDAHGHHSEADWARRLPAALQFLWGNPMAMSLSS